MIPPTDQSKMESLSRMALVKKKKKDFDCMTSSVLLEKQQHLLASLQFKAIYNHLLFVPSIGITLASGILAVLAQSGLYSERTQTMCTIWIAFLASFSVFWQSLVKQLDYGGRALLHDSTAMALTKILQLAKIRAGEQDHMDKFEKNNRVSSPYSRSNSQPSSTSLDFNEGSDHIGEVDAMADGVKYQQKASGTSSEVDAKLASAIPVEQPQPPANAEDHLTLTKQFEQALQGCTSEVPIRISTAFNALHARVNVSNKKLVRTGNAQPHIAWEKVYPALYHQMTLTIIGSKLWPYIAPSAAWAVEKTLKDFQEMDACMLKVIVERTIVIDAEYNSLVKRPEVIDEECNRSATETTPLFSV